MYLGIIGHSDDNKNKITKLIGRTMSWMIMNKEISETPSFDFRICFWDWCEEFEGKTNTSQQWQALDQLVYYASFSHPLKMIVSMFTGIPFELFNDPIKKNTYIININNLSYRERVNEDLTTPEVLFKERNRSLSLEDNKKQELNDQWMTLNDYVIYFGFYICRNYIGRDIWTNVERISNTRFKLSSTNKSSVRIYTDIRTYSEYNYIKEQEGQIIKIINNDSNKKDSVVYKSLPKDIHIDKQIVYNEADLKKLYNVIYTVCYDILHPHQ